MDIDLQSAMWPCGVVRQRYQKLNGLLYPTSNTNNTSNKPARREVTSRHGASRCAGLILIHRFPLSLLFHNLGSLPVPIRGYHLQTLLTLPWFSYTSFLSLFFSHPFSFLPPLSHSSYICLGAYSMPVQLLYRPALHYIHLYRLCYPSNTTLQI